LVLAVLAAITVFVAGRDSGRPHPSAGDAVSDVVRTREGHAPSRASRPPFTALPQPHEAPLEEDLGPGEAPADTGDGNVDRLRPELKQALAAARADAENDGFQILVNSGWRSADHQAELFREAIAKYGSADRARKWVLPPDESRHVTGEAIDIGPAAAAAWLEKHGARYGLCRVYANEPWHFEVRTLTSAGICPPLLPHA
jgi:hypothetical protein